VRAAAACARAARAQVSACCDGLTGCRALRRSSREVADSYAGVGQDGRTSLLFRYTTKALSRGVKIDYLSLYPKEEEFLYPPLTYLHCVKMERETLCGVQLLVATVEPTMV